MSSAIAEPPSVATPGRRPRRPRGALSERHLWIAQRHLRQERDVDAAIRTAVAECGLSRSHFARAFKVSTGMSPSRWHLHELMARAVQRLRGPEPIVDIALSLGFFDQAHFTNAFKRVFAMPPGVYRRSIVGLDVDPADPIVTIVATDPR
ncbi:MAG: AraC family transcriptional regulator [Luteibacter sp.]